MLELSQFHFPWHILQPAVLPAACNDVKIIPSTDFTGIPTWWWIVFFGASCVEYCGVGRGVAYGMVWCGVVWSGVVWYGVAYGMVWRGDEKEERDEWCICYDMGNIDALWYFLFRRHDFRYVTPLKETLTKMLSGELSLDAFPSLLPMPDQVCTTRTDHKYSTVFVLIVWQCEYCSISICGVCKYQDQ